MCLNTKKGVRRLWLGKAEGDTFLDYDTIRFLLLEHKGSRRVSKAIYSVFVTGIGVLCGL